MVSRRISVNLHADLLWHRVAEFGEISLFIDTFKFKREFLVALFLLIVCLHMIAPLDPANELGARTQTACSVPALMKSGNTPDIEPVWILGSKS